MRKYTILPFWVPCAAACKACACVLRPRSAIQLSDWSQTTLTATANGLLHPTFQLRCSFIAVIGEYIVDYLPLNARTRRWACERQLCWCGLVNNPPAPCQLRAATWHDTMSKTMFRMLVFNLNWRSLGQLGAPFPPCLLPIVSLQKCQMIIWRRRGAAADVEVQRSSVDNAFQGSLFRPLKKQSVKLVVGPKSNDVLKSSWGSPMSCVVCCEAAFGGS